MKLFISTILVFALFPFIVFADKVHGEDGGITNVAEAEFTGVVVAIFIITTAIIIAKITKKQL